MSLQALLTDKCMRLQAADLPYPNISKLHVEASGWRVLYTPRAAELRQVFSTMVTIQKSSFHLHLFICNPTPHPTHTMHPMLQRESSSSNAVLLIFIGKWWYLNSDFLHDFPPTMSHTAAAEAVWRGATSSPEKKNAPTFCLDLIQTACWSTHTHALNFVRREQGVMVDQEISPQHSIWLERRTGVWLGQQQQQLNMTRQARRRLLERVLRCS